MVYRRGLRIAGALAIASLVAACRKPPPSTHPVDAGPPVDHLAKDEIPEGNEKAFTLILPKAAFVIYRVEGAVEIEADLSPEQLSNYVRQHVQTTKVIAGASTTTFDDAIVPSSPKTHIHVDVRPPPPNSDHRSSMYVRDVTPAPPVPKTTDADAYKAIGRNPDGTPIDKNHVF